MATPASAGKALPFPVAGPGAAPGLGIAGGAVRFPQGLPGFPHLTRFRLEPLAGSPPFLLLTASESPGVRFVLLAGAAGLLGEADLAAASAVALGGMAAEVAVLLVVSLHMEAGERRAFVNLRAPILLDTARQVAAQHILADPRYPVRHPLPADGRGRVTGL